MKVSLRPAGLILAIVLMMLAAPSRSAETAPDGGKTYGAKCASCHGADGSGNTAIGKRLNLRDLGSADVQKQSDDELAQIIDKGKGKMPGFGSKLSKAQIDDLVKYIRSLKK